MPDVIQPATTADDFADFAAMVREYVDWCRARYANDSWFVDAAFSHQSLEAELQSGFASYRPPNGRTLLAKLDGRSIGCVAYRDLSNEVCEMKRLFVRPEGNGRGAGRKLCMALIDMATADGYSLMRLDTANLLTEAIGLYRSIGFAECPPYNDYPDDLMRYIVFMERPLLKAR
jgi:ribosomal protein S18 acetylase RimI-like enzyme